jgi:hypothetical protein
MKTLSLVSLFVGLLVSAAVADEISKPTGPGFNLGVEYAGSGFIRITGYISKDGGYHWDEDGRSDKLENRTVTLAVSAIERLDDSRMDHTVGGIQKGTTTFVFHLKDGVLTAVCGTADKTPPADANYVRYFRQEYEKVVTQAKDDMKQ